MEGIKPITLEEVADLPDYWRPFATDAIQISDAELQGCDPAVFHRMVLFLLAELAESTAVLRRMGEITERENCKCGQPATHKSAYPDLPGLALCDDCEAVAVNRLTRLEGLERTP